MTSDETSERSTIDGRALLVALIITLALGNVVLLAFVGVGAAVIGAAGLGLAGLAVMLWRYSGGAQPLRVSTAAIGVGMLVALALLLLGGEGRLLYANTDWQVRDALLRDMGRMAWPYVYPLAGGDQMLRAPIGMYLLPALIGGDSQRAIDTALLAQNTLIIGAMLALGSALFRTPHARAVALIVFIAFSGLDIIGTAIAERGMPLAEIDHIENWADLQYSSTITLAFWVPNHAIPGWLCALCYLLWRDRRISLLPLMCAVPLGILWSPLAAMGALPFAAMVGLETLWRRQLRAADVAGAVVAVALAAPALLYLRSGSSTVAGGLLGAPFAPWLLTMVLEVFPFALPLLFGAYRARLGGIGLVITIACLMLMPLYWIGPFPDFQRRAAIMALAVLAVAVADMVLTNDAANRGRRRFLIASLAIGAVTGGLEIRRSLSLPPSPAPRCSFVGAWDNQTSVTGGLPPTPAGRALLADKSTYLTPVGSIDARLRPQRYARVPIAADPVQCWGAPWPMAKEFTRTFERMRKAQLAQ